MLSKAKFDRVLASQTASARKVFEVIPQDQTLPMHRIITMVGTAGLNNEHSVMAGCLNTLVQSGLLMEPQKGHFCRAKYREVKPRAILRVHKAAGAEVEADNATAAAEVAPNTTLSFGKALADHAAAGLKEHVETAKAKKTGPEDRLGDFAADLRKMADNMEKMAKAAGDAAEVARVIAEGLEHEAIDFAALCEENSAALEKLRGFKNMFANL